MSNSQKAVLGRVRVKQYFIPRYGNKNSVNFSSFLGTPLRRSYTTPNFFLSSEFRNLPFQHNAWYDLENLGLEIVLTASQVTLRKIIKNNLTDVNKTLKRQKLWYNNSAQRPSGTYVIFI